MTRLSYAALERVVTQESALAMADRIDGRRKVGRAPGPRRVAAVLRFVSIRWESARQTNAHLMAEVRRMEAECRMMQSRVIDLEHDLAEAKRGSRP